MRFCARGDGDDGEGGMKGMIAYEIGGDSAQGGDEGEDDRLWMRAVRCAQWMEEEGLLVLRSWRAMSSGSSVGEVRTRERVVWARDFYIKVREGY